MDRNPLMDAFRKEFLRRVEAEGFYHSAGEQSGENIYHGPDMVAVLTEEYGLRETGAEDKGWFDQLVRLRESTLEPYVLFRDAPTLLLCDEPDTRVLCEFDRVALTASVRLDGAMEFATWQVRYDRTGIRDRHDCGVDFVGAKEQFSIRAGLAPRERLFSNEELEVLARACDNRLVNAASVGKGEEKTLKELRSRLLVLREQTGAEIGIRQVGVSVGLFRQRTEPGYILANGDVLLESERDAQGNYLGGAGMEGMYLKTGAVYAPVLDDKGGVRGFRKVEPPPPTRRDRGHMDNRRGHDAPEH